MSKRIEYTKGQEIGNNGITYIKEVEPHITASNRKIRRAEFKCGHCGKNFIASIESIKQNKQKSCGCLKHKRNQIEYEEGQTIGDFDVVYVKDIFTEKYKKRQAEFICPRCGKHFVARIQDVKSNKIQSCGCLIKEIGINSLKQYHKEHPFSNKRINYKENTIIGENNVIFIKEVEKKNEKRQGIFQCPICGDYFISYINSVRNGRVKSCGKHNSLGEEKIIKILIEHSIKYECQKTFDDLKSLKNRPYRFDFYLLDYNILIEYDGEQHFTYDKNPDSIYNKECFIKTQESDKIKNEYCLKNNIPLIRIPYTDFNKLDYNYLLDRIKEVMPNCALLV